MRKTLLAALIGASVFAVLPALAQVDLGAVGRAGAGVTGATGAVSGAPDPLAPRPAQGLQRRDRDARHATRRTTDRADRTLDRHGRIAVDAGASGSAGARAGDREPALVEAGYEPHRDDAGAVDLHNCPFHRLARQYTELVCGVNLELLRGVAGGAGDDADRAVLDPRPGRCCVRLLPEIVGGSQ